MAMTPRGTEYKPVLDIMEMPGFKDGAAMAKAVVKEVFASLTMRETYVLALFEGGRFTGITYGPYPSEKDAEKAAKLIGSTAFEFGVLPVNPAGVLAANGDRMDGGGFGYCGQEGCGHAGWAHRMDGTSRGACTERGCPCENKKFKKT